MIADTSQGTQDEVQALCERIKQTCRQRLITMKDLLALNDQLQLDLRAMSRQRETTVDCSQVSEAVQVMVECEGQIEQMFEGRGMGPLMHPHLAEPLIGGAVRAVGSQPSEEDGL